MQVNTKFLVCSLIYMGGVFLRTRWDRLLWQMKRCTYLSFRRIKQKNERNITGRIIDGDTGEALIGVSILVKGASMGTVTDVDGKFSLSVATGDVLEISYIGYKKPVDSGWQSECLGHQDDVR